MLKIIYPCISMAEIEKFDKEKILFIDTRSPKEFLEHSIPGAVNLPVLDDDARIEVGKLYNSGFHEDAILKGIEAISKNLVEIVSKIFYYKEKYQHIILYCARGGYRSTSLYVLLKSLHINVEKLDGGYKSYRKYIVKNLEKEIDKRNFYVLSGKTGTGKTEILNKLKEKGLSILDLEGLANHRGSLLGHVGMIEQPDQKMFESKIYDAIKTCDTNIFIEGESRRIGKLYLPNRLYDKMTNGVQILIKDSIDSRVKRIHKDYVIGCDIEIMDGLESLKRYISNKDYEIYKNSIEKGEYDFVIKDLCIKYYDKNYSIYKKDYDYSFTNDENIIDRLVEILNK